MGRNATQRNKRTNKRKVQRGGADVNDLCDLIFRKTDYIYDSNGESMVISVHWKAYLILNDGKFGSFSITPTPLLRRIINTHNSRGQTPLYLACRYYPAIIQYLLDAGANVNLINHDGSTPAIGCTFITNPTSLQKICETLSILITNRADLSLAKGDEKPFINLQKAADAGLLLP